VTSQLLRKQPKYKPYGWQHRVHARKKRMKLIQVGRRGGKGRMSLQEALSCASEASRTPILDRNGKVDENALLSLIPPIHLWGMAPTYKQAKQMWNEMKGFTPEHLVRRPTARGNRSSTGWNEAEMEVWLDFKDPAGKWLNRPRPSAYWEIKSADNYESLQTVGLDFLWITEAQDIREEAWDKVRPTLRSPHRFGRVIIEGIPPISSGHWFARLLRSAGLEESQFSNIETDAMYQLIIERKKAREEIGVEFAEKGTMLAVRATTFDNPDLTLEDVESIFDEKDTTSDAIWRRHYLAAPAVGGSGFFRLIREAARGAGLAEPAPGRRYVAGLDIGRKEDETVLVIKDRRTRESVYAESMAKREWTSQREAIIATCAWWNIEELTMDATSLGGAIVYDELANANLPVRAVKFTSQQKFNLWTDYAIALERKTVTFPAHWQKLINQLEAGDAVQNGMVYKFTQVDGGHDDWMDAEMLALFSCDPVDEFGAEIMATPSKQGVAPMRPDDLGRRRSEVFVDIKSRRSAEKFELMKEQNPEWAEQFESGVL
jgi:hypothetical protein